MKIQHLKAMIFDMDGLMFDTERLYYQSWLVFKDVYGIRFDEKIKQEYNGLNRKDSIKKLVDQYGNFEKMIKFRQQIEQWRKEKLTSYTDSLKKEGLDELLDFLDYHKIKKIIATGTALEIANFLLQKEDLTNRFDTIISGESCSKGKPDPEIFQKALQLIGASPHEAVVLEDSINGAVAANRAGIKCFAIPDSSFTIQPNYPNTAKVFSNLLEVKKYLERKD